MKIFYNPKVSEDNKTVHAKSSKAANSIYDFLQTFFYMTAIVVLAMVFVVRPVSVDGRSMNPTLWDKDIMLVTNYYSAPKTGDIVIITHGKKLMEPLVKRVIATEGQKLSINFKKSQVRVDGKVLNEPYTQGKTIVGNGVIPEVVPKGKLFVMGDNREHSTDSRFTEVGLFLFFRKKHLHLTAVCGIIFRHLDTVTLVMGFNKRRKPQFEADSPLRMTHEYLNFIGGSKWTH